MTNYNYDMINRVLVAVAYLGLLVVCDDPVMSFEWIDAGLPSEHVKMYMGSKMSPVKLKLELGSQLTFVNCK